MKARFLCGVSVNKEGFEELDALITKEDMAGAVAWIRAHEYIGEHTDDDASLYSWETDLALVMRDDDYILTFDDFIYESINLYKIVK